MARQGSTRIRQEMKSTSQDGLKAGLSLFCIPRADPTPTPARFLWTGDTHWRKVKLQWSH